jgi:hypothetical protein
MTFDNFSAYTRAAATLERINLSTILAGIDFPRQLGLTRIHNEHSTPEFMLFCHSFMHEKLPYGMKGAFIMRNTKKCVASKGKDKKPWKLEFSVKREERKTRKIQ